MKKVLALILAAVMVLGLVACNKPADDPKKSSEKKETEKETAKESEKETEKETEKEEETSAEAEGVTFPLAEKKTFTIMVCNDLDVNALISQQQWWKDLEAATNVHIDFMCLPTTDTLTSINNLATAGKAGDAYMGGSIITDSALISLAANKQIIPLQKYIDDKALMPNFNERVLDQEPQCRKLMATPDGNVYSLIRYRAQEGSYIESPIWLNKVWMDQLGLEIPTTTDELEKVLLAFAENDCNGNGDATDEIPYAIKNGDGSNHFEPLLGAYGIATKDGTFENFTYLDNGKVTFAPVTDAYKEYIEMMARWWSEGLIWEESFTCTAETYTAKITSETPVIGMICAKQPPTSHAEDYVCIPPVNAEGYKAAWYMHPGLWGIKNVFTVFSGCENPEILMAWVDQLYTFENSCNILYGNGYEMKDGKFVQKELTESEKEADEYFHLNFDLPSSWTADDFANKITKGTVENNYDVTWDLYSEHLTKETWPRPYIGDEDANRVSELRTDIMNTIKEKKASWITGQTSVDDEWDDFVKSIDKMGVSEFIDIYQKVYDNYQSIK